MDASESEIRYISNARKESQSTLDRQIFSALVAYQKMTLDHYLNIISRFSSIHCLVYSFHPWLESMAKQIILFHGPSLKSKVLDK